jgi:hypothetical protein
LRRKRVAFNIESESFILQSVQDFIRTSEESRMSDPKYMLTSTANYIATAEKILRERFVNKDTAIGFHMMQAMAEQQKGQNQSSETSKPITKSSLNSETPTHLESTEQIDIAADRKKIDEVGFYQHTMARKEAEKLEQGQFYIENGKMYYGPSAKREPVSYSNWYAGNVDPEQMTRHKELLDRQHFSGPFWDKRPLPKSVMDETFEEYMTGLEGEPTEQHPKDLGLQPKDDAFEKVKR